MKDYIAIIVMGLIAFSTHAQHDHGGHSQEKGNPSFKDGKVGTAYEHYIHLKDALVSSNSREARNAAGELQKSLAAVTGGAKVAEEAGKISASADLSVQRKTFSSLSDEMATLVKANKPASGAVFLEYCPMANNNAGAFWLSNEKEIKNPYFGDMMLKCGSVKETIQ